MNSSFAAFLGPKLLALGPLPEVARAVSEAMQGGTQQPLLIFDAQGEQVELDLRGSPDEAAQRAAARIESAAATASTSTPAARTRGRPALGVVAREVTLLPRHWEWLALQPGGASVALRRLIDEARRGERDVQQASKLAARAAQERCYRFLRSMAGNLPNYEEALRALFGGQVAVFEQAMSGWPEDVRAHALRLAAGDNPSLL